MTNRTDGSHDSAAERAAFFACVTAELRQVVTDALQQGHPTAQVQEQYQAVLQRAGERLQARYGIPTAYLPDILPAEQQIDLLLTAIGDLARERATQHRNEAAA